MNSKSINKILFVINGHQFTAKHRIPLIKHLLTLGYKVRCIIPENSDAQKELIINNIITINWVASRKGLNPFSEIKSIYQLFQIYKKESPKVVIHATIKPVLYGTIASYLAKRGSIINLITGLGSVFISEVWYKKIIRVITLSIYDIIFRFIPQTIVFQNNSDKHQLLKNYNYPLLKTVTIPGSGVTVSDFPLHNLPSQKRVTLIGRIIKDKGIHLFIETAKIVKEKRKDVSFILVGPLDIGNPSFINKELIRKWESDKTIEWWGDVNNILDVYKESSIIILPSLREGLPKALLEAGLCGRPVIASDVPGCREVVVHGKTGYLFPSNDSETFASYILDLLDKEEEMKKMGLAGREYVINNFSTDVIIPQLVNVIEKNINRKILCR